MIGHMSGADYRDGLTARADVVRAVSHLAEMLRTVHGDECRMYDFDYIPGREIPGLLARAARFVDQVDAAERVRWYWVRRVFRADLAA